MRLHSLEITAFGPFPGTTTVDFDALSAAGLFLLSGPTGAGKSSVLDAIAFALYGDVPGDRGGTKRLRCDTAPEGVAPRVVLEATLAGRRFRIDRSPAWTRPKRRGTGTTTEQARVAISEFLDDTWQARSTRLDETGHLVSGLVGMNLSQFCQVAMLPQGRFQAFLRARSEERHALLQQLFRTGRFDQVERWLRERRAELRRQAGTHQAAAADLVSRICEIATSPAPDDWESSPTTLPGWSHRLQAEAREREEVTASTLAAVTQSLDAAVTTRDVVAAQDHARRTGHDAAERLRRLASDSAGVEAATSRLQSAALAAALQPVLTLLDDAMSAAADANAAHDAAVVDLCAILPPDLRQSEAAPDPAALQRRILAAQADVVRLTPVIERLADDAQRVHDLEACVCGHAERLTMLSERADALPGELGQARRQLELATAAATELPLLEARLHTLQARLEAVSLSTSLRAEAAEADAAAAAARLELDVAREAWLDVREQRLDGMAAEMAGGLVAGCECPVCGSPDHPSPAAAATGSPDAQAEKAARSVVDDAEIHLEARRQHARELATRLAVAQAQAGDPDETLADQVGETGRRLADARVAAAEADGAADTLRRLEDEAAHLSAQREQALHAHAGARAELDEARRHLADNRGHVDALASQWHVTDPGMLGASLSALEAAVGRVLDHDARREACRLTGADARAAAESACEQSGFATLDHARSALLADAEVHRLKDYISAHQREYARLEDLLSAPDVAAALAMSPPPDLAAAEAAVALAQDRCTAARRDHDAASAASARLRVLVDELRSALTTWLPVASALDDTAALAAFVEGKAPDNRLQMRLSAYVLAHRLGQVVDAANLRLRRMSSQRYVLVHTGQRGSRETRGGLSLLVRDEWSGEARDPATLSGGETFVVSLALALGLADVITDEAGGADLHTLFVDEGFGALDAATLDDVMDTLDELRDAGRVVGVVSHVAELQTRIPTQLRVKKDRSGSTTRVQVG